MLKQWGRTYRRAWKAIVQLDVPIAERGGLQELATADVTMLGSWLEDQKYRSKGDMLPWIWRISCEVAPEGASLDEIN